MNANQQIFADEYLRNGRNATKAYRAAYPQCKSDHAAHTAGGRLLRNVEISQYINNRLRSVSNSKIMSITEIMEHYTAIARGETSEQTVTNRGDVVETAAKVGDRIQALKALSKMLGAENGLDRERFELEKTKANASGDTPTVVIEL